MKANTRSPALVLTREECLELLQATTVGRVGFSHPDGIKILPVNYVAFGDGVIIRTSPSGVIARLADGGTDIAFEVDYHNPTSGYGWSVLLNGPIRALTAGEIEALHLPARIIPWASGDRSVHLLLSACRVDGRRVQRRRSVDR